MAMNSCFALVVGALALVAAEPTITSLSPRNESLEAHHTSFYTLSAGFAVRRGQSFDVDVVVESADNVNLDAATFSLFNDAPVEYNNPSFTVVFSRTADTNTYVLSVSTPVGTPVGKYEHIVLSIAYAGQEIKYDCPFPIYVLFNAWNPKDTEIFIPSEGLRQEHILNEYGDVWQGSLESNDKSRWYYGQSNQITLDAVFHVLDKMDRTDAADPVKVMQTVSKYQGMMRPSKMTGGRTIGTWDALLEGNWGDWPTDMTNGPERWVSVPDILKRWQETKRPAQYGQCWVFAALQNGLMRAIGIGSRQISGFGAVVDASGARDPARKPHHVISYYYDLKGDQIYTEGMGWNFHSWNQVYLSSDWATLDGTPSGTFTGPAPTAQVRALTDGYLYNVSQVISTVHSSTRVLLVTCDDQHKKGTKLDHCTVLGPPTKYEHTGLKLIVSSRTDENGDIVQHNVTSEYVDPSLDACIPFEDGDACSAIAGLPVTIKPLSYNVTVGDNIAGSVEIDTSAFVQGEFVQLNMKFTLETYTGSNIKTLQSIDERVLIKGSKVSVPWVIDKSAYLDSDINDLYVKMVVVGTTEDNKYFFDDDVLDIDAPEVQINVRSEIVVGSGSVPFRATFTNPLDFDLEEVCVRVHSFGLKFEGKSPTVTEVVRCVALKARETMDIRATLVAPSATGKYYVLANVVGDFLPVASSHVDIRVVEGSGSHEIAIAACSLLALCIAASFGWFFCARRRRLPASETTMSVSLQQTA